MEEMASNQSAGTTGDGGAAASSATTPDAGAATVVNWVNQDGTLKPGWQNELVPEDFRGRPVYNAVGNDVAGLLRHIGHQDKVISKQGKGVFPPSHDSNDIERDMFYKAIGRPDKPEEYKLELQGVDEATLAEARTVFHKAGLTQDQVKAIVEYDRKRQESAAGELKANPLKYFEELLPQVQPIYKERAEAELKAKWGDNYDARMHLANRAVVENTKDGEDREVLLARIGNDPIVADFLATMASKYFTDGSGVDTSTGGPVAGAGSIQQRIEEIMSDPNYFDSRTNPLKHKRLVEDAAKLFEMKNKVAIK